MVVRSRFPHSQTHIHTHKHTEKTHYFNKAVLPPFFSELTVFMFSNVMILNTFFQETVKVFHFSEGLHISLDSYKQHNRKRIAKLWYVVCSTFSDLSSSWLLRDSFYH